ncbi:hypothetical protein V1512DRAFT_259564 [Lipomyces arxii]|uniref:uncharacterized protein n=1 Tax=Lipomyces arxii TaxID=56418 RepID=UPI0034CE72F9
MENNKEDSQQSKRTVKKISLAEFQRRQNHHQNNHFNNNVEQSVNQNQHSRDLNRRIQEHKRSYANGLISQYETLFFSDHVDMSSTPIQRFFPVTLFDPAAVGYSPLLASDKSQTIIQSFIEWYRDLRRNMFFKVQANRHKIWDEYDKTFARESSALSASSASSDSSSSGFPLASSSDSDSDSDSNFANQISFVDSAFPVPSPQQYQRCKVSNGTGVWDTMGVWRCLVGNSNFITEATAKHQAFTKFEDYMNWKISRRAQSPFEDMPDPQFLMRSLFDSGAIPPFESALEAKRDPGAPKKPIGHSTVVTSSIDENGKRTDMKKVKTFYDDGSVDEKVDENNSNQEPIMTDIKAWIKSQDWSNEADYIKRASDILVTTADSLGKSGLESFEKTRELIDQYMSNKDNKVKSFLDKFWPSSSKDDDEKRKK